VLEAERPARKFDREGSNAEIGKNMPMINNEA
jgi:hypothetical protein